MSFVSTTCSTPAPLSTQTTAASVIKGRFGSPSASAPFFAYDMFGSGSNYRSSYQKAVQPLPPSQTQSSILNAFRHNPPNKHNGPAIGGALKSSHGPSLNAVLKKNSPSRTTPPQVLKPSETVAHAFERSSSFTDSGFEPSPAPSIAKPQSQMSALHQAVFFDEGDFEDDGDLDFDDSTVYESPKYSISASPTSFFVPEPPHRVLPPLDRKQGPAPTKKRSHESINDTSEAGPASQRAAPNSSAPLPWSSSPAEHLVPPSRPSSGVPGEIIDLTDEPEPEPKAKKRRTPWAGRKEAASASMIAKAIASSRAESITAEPQLPRNKQAQAPLKKPQYPWDMTASDLKKASTVTRRRSDQKRGFSTAAGQNDGTGKKALKQKKLSLSNEQMHVLDLVLKSGKSVFFTGSAGQCPRLGYAERWIQHLEVTMTFY